jgi:hypothetical protein
MRFGHLAGATLLALAAGCTGRLNEPDGHGGSYGDPTGPSGPSGPSVDDKQRETNPSLHAVATKYFPGQTATAGKKRLFRLTRTQLDFTTKALLPDHFTTSTLATFPRDPLETNYEYASNLSFNPANFTPYTNWVKQLVEGVRAAPATVIDCASNGNSPACLDEKARALVTRAFRGVVTDAQLARYSGFFTNSVPTVGLAAATADLVDLTLTSPSYVFREEVLTDGAGALLPAQRLQNITYTLADAPPEAVGLQAPSAASVQSPQAVQQTIDSVLATADARAKLLRFLTSWLEVREPEDFVIATSVFPEFTPEVAAAVVAETKAFLERQLSTAAPRLRDVTESNQAFVSNATAFLYKRPASATFIDLDPAQRLGIFTQPAVIASHSGPTTTRLVKRGVFFTRKVMCLPLGNPPDDVDTTVPVTPGATERQKIEQMTLPAKCAGCHAYINPFGFMQENFDAIGRWRTTDQGLPVDASIAVDFLDEGPLSTSSPVEALRGFTRSLRFQQCFTRQLFRFYMGRREEAGDDPLLRQMFFDFANNGDQDIVRMLRTLASAPIFSQRAEAP